MDVHCSSCGEPWDVYHLWHEAIHETDLGEEEIRLWTTLPPSGRLAPPFREAFQHADWTFGSSVLDVRHCPACGDETAPDPESVALKTALCELLGEDEDGLAAMMEDHGL